MTTDQLGGTTYTFANLAAFLANAPTTDPVSRRPERAEPVQQRRHRRSTSSRTITSVMRRTSGGCAPNLTLNYGLRYDYYTPLHEADNLDREVQYRHRRDRPQHDAALRVEEEQLPAARRRRPTRRRRRPCFGRLSASSSALARPKIRFSRSKATASARRWRVAARFRSIRRCFAPTSSTTRTIAIYQPRAYANDYTIPERIYRTPRRCSSELPSSMASTVAYVGSQGRNLFLRSVANQIVGS